MAGELDGPRLEPPGGQAKRLVVFLHGYGADGNDLIDIGRAWQGLLPDTAFVSPHAPEPCGQAPIGGSGFRCPSARRTSAGSASTRPAAGLERFLDAELARRKLPPSALALVGFSQGTMMALHVGLRRAVPPAAIVGYSGIFVLPEAKRRRRRRGRDQIAAAGPARPRRPGRPDPGAGAVPGAQALAALEVPVEWHLSEGASATASTRRACARAARSSPADSGCGLGRRPQIGMASPHLHNQALSARFTIPSRSLYTVPGCRLRARGLGGVGGSSP